MNKKRRQKTTSTAFDLAQHERKPYFLPALGLCGLLMGILLFDANLSLTGDNAQFINLGRAGPKRYKFTLPLDLRISGTLFLQGKRST